MFQLDITSSSDWSYVTDEALQVDSVMKQWDFTVGVHSQFFLFSMEQQFCVAFQCIFHFIFYINKHFLKAKQNFEYRAT